ncbi:MAG: T9SS type A sorting domain-containing protein [Sphingobacteriales bacterium]|nr:MAG: T9SS type A sorting domain-containing protein [Sphingobacteriales bacterium]
MQRITPFRLLALVCAFCSFTHVYANPAESSPNSKFSKSNSLVFIENNGQVTDQFHKQRGDIDFKLSASGMNIYIGDGQVHYQWSKTTRAEGTGKKSRPQRSREMLFERPKREKMPLPTCETYRLDVVLAGANSGAKLIMQEEQEYYEHYYGGDFEGKVSSYRKAIYKDIYPNIDWVLYIRDNQLKYDFIVHAGGNPADIKLKYNGATSLAIKDGAFTATTPFGSITEQAPYTYDALTKAKLSSSFILKEQTLSFAVNGKCKGDMIIDPALVWATYYGGGEDDNVTGIKSDSAGRVYAAGHTLSSSNIATTGAFLTTWGMNTNSYGFIAAFRENGLRRWATYYGNNVFTSFYNVEIDPSGNVYAAGETDDNSGLATAGAFKTTISRANASDDNLLAKFDSTGSRIWCTYFGGDWEEGIPHIACDNAGNVYLGGNTNSDSLIASGSTVFRPTSTWADGLDCYLAKFNSSGARLWSTYFGGNGYDQINDMECDVAGNVYFIGISSSTGLASSGAWSTSGTAFLSKFNGSGGRVWTTYLEPSTATGMIYANGMTLDSKANIYITGCTGGHGLATTGLDTTLSGWDGYLAKFDSSGVRKWGTYVGGNDALTFTAFFAGDAEELFDVHVSPIGNIYTIGINGSTDNATAGAWKSAPTSNTDIDVMFSEFDSTGKRLWTTLWGGPREEVLWIDPYDYNDPYDWGPTDVLSPGPGGKLFFCGKTESTTDIATTGAHQTTNQSATSMGEFDGFLGCFVIDTMVYLNPADTAMCTGQALTLSYNVSLPFNTGNTFTVQLSNASGSFASPTTIGTVSSAYGGNVSWTVPSAMTPGSYKMRVVASSPSRISPEVSISVYPPVSVSAGFDTAVCAGDTIKLNASSSSAGTISYTWSGPSSYSAIGKSVKRASAATAMAGNYIVTATRGCTARDTVGVTVGAATAPAVPDASYTAPLCVGDTLRLSATVVAGASYTWTGPNSFTASTRQPEKRITQLSDSGFYIVRANAGGCSSAPDTIKVKINKVSLDVTVSPNDTICEGTAVVFTAATQTGTATPACQWYKNALLVSGVATNTYSAPALTPNDSIIYCSMTVSNVCAHAVTLNDTVKMLVKPMPVVTAGSNSPACEGDTLKLVSNSIVAGSIGYSWAGPGAYASAVQSHVRLAATTYMSGDYIVTTSLNGCSHKDTVTVLVNPTPATPDASYTAPLCVGDTLRLSSTVVTGATYNWTGPNSFNASVRQPLKQITQLADSGYYVVKAIIAGCISLPDTVKVKINTLFLDVLVSPDDTICEGTAVTFTATLPNVSAAPSCLWYNGVTPVAGTAPNVYSTSGLLPGVSTIYANTRVANVCADTVSVTDTVRMMVKALPVVMASNDTLVCYDDTLRLTANDITGATYSWSGPNAFTSTLQHPSKGGMQIADSGSYIVVATLDGCSSMPDTAWIGVMPQLSLDVQLVAYPGTGVRDTDTVTLEATLPNGGILMTYNWYKNGVLVATTTSDSFRTTGLTDGDTMVVVATTAYPCAIVNTAMDTVAFYFPASAGVVTKSSGLRLYPNPNKGSFVVQGITTEAIDVAIVNAIGQVVHKDKMNVTSGTINIKAQLPVGHYLLKLNGADGADVLKFVVLE